MPITCENCGKYNSEAKQTGDHWVCGDCKHEPAKEAEKE